MLPIVLPAQTVHELIEEVNHKVGAKFVIDLSKQTITTASGKTIKFETNEFRKFCLLNGLDDIGITLQHEAEIRSYEAKHRV